MSSKLNPLWNLEARNCAARPRRSSLRGLRVSASV